MDKMKYRNCDYKKMFGYPAYFFNGNMFVGVHGDKLFLRLSSADMAEIIEYYRRKTRVEMLWRTFSDGREPVGKVCLCGQRK